MNVTSSVKRLSPLEFIALTGMLFASVAFSIDAMLPALPDIAKELTPSSPNSAQLIISSFVVGMGIGTLFAGPLSDSFGRKPVILFGGVLYVSGAALAWWAHSLELILLGRVLQGLGAAGPRVVSLAVVRDLFEGREMARIVSLAMLIFTLFPAVAPLIGLVIIEAFGWRAIFLSFMVFAIISIGWLMIRQPETLPRPDRRKLNAPKLWSAMIEVLSNRLVVISIAVQSLIFAMLFATIATIQPTFDITFGMAKVFPYWFGAIAVVSAIPSILNAVLVVRLGMRRMISSAIIAQLVISTVVAISLITLDMSLNVLFWVYLVWNVSLFAMLGFTIGNLNALALQPMGHIAGMAASVMGSISTLVGGALGAPLGLLFDGTPVPMAWGVLVLVTIAWVIFRKVPAES